ncbi:DUF1735 and LamG domain-containing protein [Bacteroides helcogenes]|uniref:BT-3987-like N-terminal domain-containing protein n=1 Tax=Bacteroides helcogenes (strain ATCC 35417 / DSM 20613 / JCM 6297 / CCUG 15421 / P 36-108) TaxID=693979 RepID=E6SPK6_BACT6|nr:DUF1735 and LamG domain-containing protein [Bacteroides helcogenes]ADV43847.1 domain of unknown function DUF1735 [Bacteroides helcogenes P 36-108]MDY5237476.1 DUF1735 and LamG domain-containing protein [Bacteroides helcogenes]
MEKTFKYLLTGALAFFIASCTSVDVDDVNAQTDLPNAIYLDGVQSSPMKKIVVDANGGEATFLPRAANLLTSDVTVDITVDSASLALYNKEYGTSYRVLPTEYYDIEKMAVTIKSGTISAEPVNLVLKKNALTVNPSFKYAIPVKINTTSPLSILDSNSYEIFALDRVLETSAMHQDGFYMRCDLVPLPHNKNPMVLKEWTLHYGMKIESWFANQQPVMGSFYSRITANGKLQYKPGGSDDPKGFSKQPIQPGKWYHVTYTYKNQHVKAYINGVLEFEFDVPTQNEEYYKIQASFGNFRGHFRDIRLYKKALTEFQITENLYVEDPANPDLIVYAPLTKESALKDVTGHGYDFKAYKTGGEESYPLEKIQWEYPLYFPEK